MGKKKQNKRGKVSKKKKRRKPQMEKTKRHKWKGRTRGGGAAVETGNEMKRRTLIQSLMTT